MCLGDISWAGRGAREKKKKKKRQTGEKKKQKGRRSSEAADSERSIRCLGRDTGSWPLGYSALALGIPLRGGVADSTIWCVSTVTFVRSACADAAPTQPAGPGSGDKLIAETCTAVFGNSKR